MKFSKNWNNKLSWGIFTTVRLWTPDKEIYYKSLKGRLNNIVLKNEFHSRAYLWLLKKMLLKDIPDYVKIQDTGLTPREFDNLIKKFYSMKDEWKGGDTPMLVLVYVKDDEE